MFDIITIGSAVYDVFVSTKKMKLIKSKKFSTGVGECFALGSKLPIDSLAFDTGGGATNTAVTFKHCGFKTAVVCRIGNDTHGKQILSVLKNERIDTQFVQIDPLQTTGYSVILMAGIGDRTILTYRGASAELSPSTIPFSKLKAKWFYICSLGGNTRLLSQIVDHALKNHIKIACNPGGHELSNGKKILLKLLPYFDVFNVNMEEASQFLGLPFANKIKVLRAMQEIIKNVAVVTDGSFGAYAITQDDIYFIPTTKKKVVNATGAGDAFGSAFVAGLILKNDISFALKLALLNSESVVQKVGAKNGIITKVPSLLVNSKIKKL